MSPAPSPRRAGANAFYFAIPLALLCIAVYWQALGTWFHMDDFAWLGLPLDVRSSGLLRTLFHPEAQGTVRVFSERIPFLLFTSIFGINTAPFKILIFMAQFVNLTLIALLARRLTGDTLAGFIAATAFLFNSALTAPMAWVSAGNEILWTTVVLLSFWFLLRYIDTGRTRYNAYQWIVFLLGFGVLELNVVYPAIATFYTFCCGRRYLKSTLLLWIPSILFAVLHFTLIPKTGGDIYRMYVDSGIVLTFVKYIAWAAGPSRIGGLIDPGLRWAGYTVTALVAAALVIFVATRRNWLVAFLCGWFVIVIAPVLPLKNHVTDYYLTTAIVGPCILAGWAFSSARKTSRLLTVVASVVLAAYCAGHYIEYRNLVDWRYKNSRRLRDALYGIDAAYRKSPREMVLLAGVDWDLFAAGFNDNPFRLLGIRHIYLVPGSETQLATPDPPRGVEQYKLSPNDAARALAQNAALVLSVSDDRVVDVTQAYSAIARSQNTVQQSRTVDVGLPSFASSTESGWYPTENGFRWMGPRATVHIAGPQSASGELTVSGYVPAAVVASGPIHITIAANGTKLKTYALSKGDEPFELKFRLPPSLAGKPVIELVASVDRTITLPGDERQLGLIFGKFSIDQ
jgi:hypothetical protein